MKKRLILTLALLMMVLPSLGCWTSPEQGKVEVQTIWGEVKSVVRPPGIWTLFVLGDDYYEVNMRSKTLSDITVRASSKEPANFTIKAQLSFSVTDNDQNIIKFVKKFGLTEEEQNGRLIPQINGVFQTEYRNAANAYDAYKLVAEQENIQKAVFETLKPIFAEQFYLTLEAVQFVNKPDFDNDNIDNAASQVVANQKLKEAAEAALAAQKVEVERKQLEAQTYANPQLLEIRKLELQKEIAQSWAQHQGTLVLGNSPVQISTNK